MSKEYPEVGDRFSYRQNGANHTVIAVGGTHFLARREDGGDDLMLRIDGWGEISLWIDPNLPARVRDSWGYIAHDGQYWGCVDEDRARYYADRGLGVLARIINGVVHVQDPSHKSVEFQGWVPAEVAS
jgi:hypothetical protein